MDPIIRCVPPEANLPGAGGRERTLDPSDWEGYRRLLHAVVDDMVAYLAAVGDRPAWRSVPADVREALSARLPRDPAALETVYAQVKAHVLPYPTGNIHPRFWGWVMGNGTHVGLLADIVASTMNAQVAGFDQSAVLVEQQVVDWTRSLLGLPAGASGVLVSGGSTGNLLGIATARNSVAPGIRSRGLAASPQPLTLYGSTATHSSVQRAAEMLGLGDEGFRRVPAREERIDVAALAAMLDADRRAGLRPFCVIGNAGTVGTGAVDDLHALADLCAREALWLHVDGAIGAAVKLSSRDADRVAGIERADSVAFDFHKWLYVQYESAILLVRDAARLREAFRVAPAYLQGSARGIAVEPTKFADLGLQLSRSFRALRVWMTLLTFGADRLGELIAQNIDQAAYLARRIDGDACLELLAPVTLCIVCFRYRGRLAAADCNDVNRELLLRLQESGVAVPSSTDIGGRFAIRVALTNHRTRKADLDLLLGAVVALGQQLERSAAAIGSSREPVDGAG